MKSFKAIYILLLSLVSFFAVQEVKAQPEESVDVNFNTFYNDLQPYGRWIDHPTYGRVWIYDEPGFRPYYTNGHWEYSNYGWSWISDYNWGWAPFHYGRWEEDPEFGWLWIPGYEWAPAWVSWSEDDDYYGWAPLGYGWDLNISLGRIPYDRWCFLPRQYITYSGFHNYCVPFERNRIIVRNTRFINNFYEGRSGRYLMGPQRGEVERITHSRIEPHRFSNQERFGSPDHRSAYSNGGFNRRQENGNFNRQENSYGNRPNDNRNYQQQQERIESRQRVFGDRGYQNNQAQRQNNPNNYNNNNNNNMYDRRNQRNYNQPQYQPERQQQSAPYRQQQPQRQFNQDNNRMQERNFNRSEPQQQPRDQRNNDRQDSRSRVFGEHHRG